MKRFIGFGILAVLASPVVSLPVHAETIVDYVKVCGTVGVADYFLIPGTDTCVNASTGQTVKQTENGPVYGLTQTEQDALAAAKAAQDAQNSANKAQEGVALGLSLPGTVVDPGKHFGASAHVGTFGGYTAVGLGAAFRLNDDVTFDAGAAIGTTYGSTGGRAGVNVSW